MPQLSLYVNEQTLERIRRAAKIENVSISKYVVDHSIVSSEPSGRM